MLRDLTEDPRRADGDSIVGDGDSELGLDQMVEELMGQVGRLDRNLEQVSKGMEEIRGNCTHTERRLEGVWTEVSNLARGMAERDTAMTTQTAAHTAELSAT